MSETDHGAARLREVYETRAALTNKQILINSARNGLLLALVFLIVGAVFEGLLTANPILVFIIYMIIRPPFYVLERTYARKKLEGMKNDTTTSKSA